jgi:putative endonuclease
MIEVFYFRFIIIIDFIIHYSLFIIHYSLFIIHYSLFIIHYSLFIIMASHNDLGKAGELAAAEFLIQNGYSIRAQNWKTKFGEIDIIAENKDWLVIAEVKSRSNTTFGKPEEAVDYRKQRTLVNMADYYIRQFKIDKETRFDILSVLINGENATVTHLTNAFSPFD